ncbi:MAG: substrate-binding domain-containing protein [Bacillota bacterium]
MKKTLAILLACILLIPMLATACTPAETHSNAQPDAASEENTTGELKSGEGKVVGFSIAQLSGNPFWQVLCDELEAGLAKNGYKLVVVDATGDVAKQTADVEDLISQGVNLILINPFDSSSIVPVTMTAKQAGIPVAALDIPIDESGYCEFTCICDNEELGYNMGWYGASKFPEQEVRVIMLSGYAGGIDSYQRRFGFIEGFSNYQLQTFSRTSLKIVFQGFANYAFDDANKMMEDALIRVGNDFDILYCENDAMALGAVKAMTEAGITGKVVLGIDGWKEFYAGIKAGTVTATGLNSPIELAAVTAETVHKFLNGVAVDDWNYTTPDVVDIKNVDKYYDPNSIY